ncbi:MAG: methyltransferase domain-containing protein [Promethearchaeota archaeon]
MLSKYVPYFENLFRLLPFFTSRPNCNSMNLFANAILDYSKNMKSKFIFYQHCLEKKYNGKKWEIDFGIYFRSFNELNPLEKRLLNLSYGKILDIGSCTGYYIPYLMDKGTVTGIEISPIINSIARKKGIDNCVIGDFLTYEFDCKFDTITLIGNDITLSGTLRGLKKVLKRFAELLNEKGQILLIISHVRILKFWHVVFVPKYNDHFGIPFKLVFLNVNFFKKFAFKHGFHASIQGKGNITGRLSYLIKLIKITN